MSLSYRSVVLIVLLGVTCCASVVEAQPARRSRPRKPQDVRREAVRSQAAELINRAATYDAGDAGEDRADPAAEAQILLARVARYADLEREEETFIIAAHAARLTSMLAKLDDTRIERVLPALMEHEELSREIVFSVWEEYDDPVNVFAVLNALTADQGVKKVARAPRLAAALCVVHDEPRGFRVNENFVPSEDPARLFAYFTNARMNRLTRSLPPELLTWVVDTVSADELMWANNRYAGKDNVGTLFHNIGYDDDHFRLGRPKKVTEHGLTLPNIQRYGGVCADQAHYACHAGRAIGVPAAVCSGQGSSVGHAWVGYLRVRGKNAWWDFDEGRYEEYTKVRGSVTDPQRRIRIPDGEVAARAASYGIKSDTRYFATALLDASRALAAHKGGWSDDIMRFAELPESESQRRRMTDREATLETRLSLLKSAAMLNPGELRIWKEVQGLAKTDAMTDEYKNRWVDAAMRLAGKDYMEFAVDFTLPLAESLEDIGARSDVLGRLFEYCRRDRPGVAAELMLANAELYERGGDPERAYEAYAFVAMEYADTSNLAVRGLRKATQMLHEHAHHQKAVDLARKAWGRTEEPDFSPEFAGQSNWYQIGRVYMSSLSLAGQHDIAQNVSRRLSNREDNGR